MAELSLDNVQLSREDLALLVGMAKTVMKRSKFPETIEGRLQRSKCQGAIERGDNALGVAARALGSERSN